MCHCLRFGAFSITMRKDDSKCDDIKADESSENESLLSTSDDKTTQEQNIQVRYGCACTCVIC